MKQLAALIAVAFTLAIPLGAATPSGVPARTSRRVAKRWKTPPRSASRHTRAPRAPPLAAKRGAGRFAVWGGRDSSPQGNEPIAHGDGRAIKTLGK